ncbi:GGDEF domain-containing protein [Pseudomonas sp. N040]|uniref:GGDEF domain-containing protein n=1 Tax=Pseudomonas sp. N040 TaxID=2785325 RepID=UPI0018A29409|nr:GGDEF domain-containing protein [Pseudomonas sp. N040]MBF7729798.1 diguanylate cyclase [Pseudomonas sp. N040]MBW7013440.1 GGDEF domain-containing protein [Pseudomonas sp. N040]
MRSIFSAGFFSGSPRRLLALLLVLAMPAGALEQPRLERVRLQLNWQHQFEFAGFYAAKAKGFYRDAGLDVEIVESKPGEISERQVIEGKAEYGISDAKLLLERHKGNPVVVLAVIFQHSPVVLLVPKDGARSVAELRGKRVMMVEDNTELLALFRKQGLSEHDYIRVDPSYDPHDLLNGKVDAMQAYASDEPDYLARAGFAFRTLSARDVGIDFYDLNLFTTERQIELHPEQVRAFRQASLRGWEYAMEHPDEIMDVLQQDYSQKHTREHMRFQYQQMVPLIQPVLIELGYMNPERWRRIAQTYAALGMLPEDFSLEHLLYDSNPPRDLRWLYVGLLLALVSLGGISLVAMRFALLSASLRSEVRIRTALQAELQNQVQVDYLTGLASRRYFIDKASDEVARARRYGLALSLCVIDLDHFKAINDTHGHKTGDRVLQCFSDICSGSLREIDIAGRMGGEEFAILLPETGLEQVRLVAERLRERLAEERMPLAGGHTLRFTVSIGVAVLTPADEDLESLIARADRALYAAKRGGRNRVCIAEG